MSRPCGDNCPFVLGGLPAEGYLEVCSSPFPQCQEIRDDPDNADHDGVIDWTRLCMVAQLGRNAILPFNYLVVGDTLILLQSADPEDDDSSLSVEVIGHTDEGLLRCQVVRDGYHADDIDSQFPLPADEIITITGSCEFQGKGNHDIGHQTGALVVGKSISFDRDDGQSFCSFVLQELVVDTGNITITMFDTLPGTTRTPSITHKTS